MLEATYVGVAGDWHGNTAHALKTLELFSKNQVRYIFQLGDFGVFGSLLEYSADKFRTRIARSLEAKDQWLFVTLGNHENYDLVERFSTVEEGDFVGFNYEPKAPRILYFKRGQSLTISGRTFLSIGGAASIDYRWRQEWNNSPKARAKVWWLQERISVLDVENTLAEARRLGSVDVLLAHDVFAEAPIGNSHRADHSRWNADDFAFAQSSRDSLQKVAEGVLPKLWLHGHYHVPLDSTVSLQSGIGKHRKGGEVRAVCFGKDEAKNSSGVLWLAELETEYLN